MSMTARSGCKSSGGTRLSSSLGCIPIGVAWMRTRLFAILLSRLSSVRISPVAFTPVFSRSSPTSAPSSSSITPRTNSDEGVARCARSNAMARAAPPEPRIRTGWPATGRAAFHERLARAGTVASEPAELPALVDHGVDGADLRVDVGDLVQVVDDRHLVGNRHGEAAEVLEGAHPRYRRLHVFHPEGQIHEIEPQLLEGPVVNRGREGMAHRVPDDGAQLRAGVDVGNRSHVRPGSEAPRPNAVQEATALDLEGFSQRLLVHRGFGIPGPLDQGDGLCRATRRADTAAETTVQIQQKKVVFGHGQSRGRTVADADVAS